MDKISAFWQRYWLRSRRNTMVIALGALAILVVSIPLQRFMPLARYQHYGTAICIFALGYLLQACISWRNLRPWGKVSYLTTGFFFFAIGLIFIYNPWLDGRVTPQNEDQDYLRKVIIDFYLVCGFIVSGTWLGQVYEEMNVISPKKAAQDSPPK